MYLSYPLMEIGYTFREGNSVGFIFTSLTLPPVEKESSIKGKNSLPVGANSLYFEKPFSEGD